MSPYSNQDEMNELLAAFQQSWPNLSNAIHGHQFPRDSNPIQLSSSIANTENSAEKSMFCSLLGCIDDKFGEPSSILAAKVTETDALKQ